MLLEPETRPVLTPPLRDVSMRTVVICWVLAGVALLVGLGSSTVHRTQEARVIETARQMVEPQLDQRDALHRWMVPTLNGEWRLRKPPLSYWLAATAYEIGGVSVGIGRTPTALAGWLTLGLTYLLASSLFGRRTGLLAAACLFSSFLFFRHFRLAETDAPLTLFVTLAVFAWWRALDGTTLGDSFWWFHLGAIGCGLAILSKGPAGSYTLLFLLAMVVIGRRWEALGRFALSGAPLLIAAVAAPWFLYAKRVAGAAQFGQELDELAAGEDHAGHAWQYILDLMRATAPWCLLMPASIVEAARSRRDPRLVGILIWIGSILVPLCIIPNKQPHYLLPLMPPLMILIGWWLDGAIISAKGEVTPLAGMLVDATLLGTALGIPGILFAARFLQRHIRPADWAVAAGLAALLAVVGWVYARRGRRAACVAYLASSLILFPVVVGVWMPRIEPDESRLLAESLDKNFGKGPFCFWGRNYSLTLCSRLRTAIPRAQTPDELRALAAMRPGLVVISKYSVKNPPPPLPAPYALVLKVNSGQQKYEIYRAP